jgi:hypothetical protein
LIVAPSAIRTSLPTMSDTALGPVAVRTSPAARFRSPATRQVLTPLLTPANLTAPLPAPNAPLTVPVLVFKEIVAAGNVAARSDVTAATVATTMHRWRGCWSLFIRRSQTMWLNSSLRTPIVICDGVEAETRF